MTAEQRFERELPELLTDLLAAPAPDYRDDIVHATARIRQRPRWMFPERWLPVQLEGLIRNEAPPLPWRALGVLALIALAIVGVLLVAGSREVPLPAPFGLASNGLIAFGDEDGVALLDPTTGARRDVATGMEPQFSPDGSKLAYYGRDANDRATLVVAAADGGSPRVLEPPIPDGPMGWFVWSPDGRTLYYNHKADGRAYAYDP
jgi:hypothetical protein